MKEVPEIKRNIKATWINGSVWMMTWISICQHKFYKTVLFRFANLEGSLQQHEANYYCGPVTVPIPHKTGLLIGCDKKWEILQHFQGKLCGKKGLLCGKLCDFFKADLTLVF